MTTLVTGMFSLFFRLGLNPVSFNYYSYAFYTLVVQ